MPINGPAVASAGFSAIFAGQTVTYAQQADPNTWESPDSMSLAQGDGSIFSVIGLGSGFRIAAGWTWMQWQMRAGFGSAADNSDNGIGYRAMTMGQGGESRVPAVSSVAGAFTGFNATVCTGGGLLYVGGVQADFNPGFQHTAGVGNDRVTYFELFVRVFN